MPGSSNILQWNPAGTNQEDDAAYAADTVRTGGATVNGILPSVTGNKGYYQWSTFLAALGQALANKGYTISDASLSSLTAVLANLVTKADLGASLATVTYATSMTFDAATVSPIVGVFQTTLTGDVSSSTLSNYVPGQVLIFIVVQDGVGGRTFVWPSQITGGQAIDLDAYAITVQAFVVTAGGASIVPLLTSATPSQSSPANSLDVVYRNTGLNKRTVSVILGCPSGAYAEAFSDSAVSPTTLVAAAGTVISGVGGTYTITFQVLPGNYYMVITQSGTPTIQGWTEIQG